MLFLVGLLAQSVMSATDTLGHRDVYDYIRVLSAPDSRLRSIARQGPMVRTTGVQTLFSRVGRPNPKHWGPCNPALGLAY